MKSRTWWALAAMIPLLLGSGCCARSCAPCPHGPRGILAESRFGECSKCYDPRCLPCYGYHQTQWREWPEYCDSAMLGQTGLRALESGILEASGEGLEIPDYPLSDPFKPEAIPTPQSTPMEPDSAADWPDLLHTPSPSHDPAESSEPRGQARPGPTRGELSYDARGMPESPFGWH